MLDPDALLRLLDALDASGYDFITPTPATHARLLKKRDRARAGNLRDIFGWSLPFETLDERMQALMEEAGVIQTVDGGRRSAVRVSRVHGRLFLHSAYPTDEEDSVFLGPDSYRFADFILREAGADARRVVDIGGGAGVGVLTAALAAPDAQLMMTDVNAKALTLAEVNARHAGVSLKTIKSDGLEALDGEADLILANPPYMIDEEDRTYRDGGGSLGGDLSVDWARQGLDRLATGGRMLLYSGSAIVDGHDGLQATLEALPGASVRYAEIDPDVFGEELERPAYAGVERIAAIGAVITRL